MYEDWVYFLNKWNVSIQSREMLPSPGGFLTLKKQDLRGVLQRAVTFRLDFIDPIGMTPSGKFIITYEAL